MLQTRYLIFAMLTLQLLSALFFIVDIWGEILGFRSQPLPWAVTEATQIFASIGLICGVVVTSFALYRSHQQIGRLDRQIGAVRGAYQDQLDALFDDWNLTKSEQEITIYAMKGFSNAEIGTLRGTSTNTVKSQMNAIYRKSDFSNRQQMTSFLVEELLAGISVDRDRNVNDCERETSDAHRRQTGPLVAVAAE